MIRASIVWSCIGAAVAAARLTAAPEAPEGDFEAIASRIAARSREVDEASIEHRSFVFRTSADHYATMRAEIVRSQAVDGAGDPLPVIEAMLASPAVVPLSARREHLRFRSGAWRWTRQVIPEFDTEAERIAAAARREGVAAASAIEHEDIAFDGAVERVLQDHRVLIIGRPRHGARFPLMQIDISLAPWDEAVALGANVPGQTVSGFIEGTRQGVVYAYPNAVPLRSGSYEFDEALGFAPTQVRVESGRRIVSEVLYGYRGSADDAERRPRVTIEATFRGDGAVSVRLWLVDRWSDSVDPRDLELDLPAEHLVVDLRTGGEPAMYVQTDLDGDSPRSRCVVVADLVALLAAWGRADADWNLDTSGTVDERDLVAFLDLAFAAP
jgi:hypothetical protein